MRRVTDWIHLLTQVVLTPLRRRLRAGRMVTKRRTTNPKSAIRNSKSLVAVLMGSKSDWETMRAASETLAQFGVAHESRVMSAHRTPLLASEFAAKADSRGIEVIIAAARGASGRRDCRAYDAAGAGRADEE